MVPVREICGKQTRRTKDELDERFDPSPAPVDLADLPVVMVGGSALATLPKQGAFQEVCFGWCGHNRTVGWELR